MHVVTLVYSERILSAFKNFKITDFACYKLEVSASCLSLSNGRQPLLYIFTYCINTSHADKGNQY
jgi:hypothetical protein